MLKKKSTPNIDGAVNKSVNFELTVADLARRSERRAWMVAFGAIVMSLILAGGYFYMLPLKEKVPYIVMADAYNGVSSVARLTDDVMNRRITASDAINRSNIAHFVLARESYDVAMINLRDWATVLTMASPNVASGYTSLHAPANPASPFKTYGRDRAIRVKILSIVLIGGGQGVTPKGATVRFQRTVYNKVTGLSTPLDSKIATMEFAYKPNLKMDDQYRIENPLGFQVTDYRVDSDYGESPPEEVPAAAADSADGTAPSANAPAANPVAPEAPQAIGIPPSPVPAEGSYPAVAVPANAAAQLPAAAPAPAPRSTANGGRR
ncbi:type IV secretion system protein VirB8 [Luteibacter rhizovicinus]|uniref:Type IV secretion system protein VirB8 n=1 Tax=Luteibacter rhizovicinus TaxID=242606 RepID=A0A4R3YXG0_9GAMM|nr:type IV secretion system protein [Luteibacter rhizovicinus]TCV97232.1 type IV secretion system protein VirB8 [Luteibacter rhizovicinus]